MPQNISFPGSGGAGKCDLALSLHIREKVLIYN